MKWDNLTGVSTEEINNRIKALQKEIDMSPDADPRDAFEIRHWKEEIIFLKEELKKR